MSSVPANNHAPGNRWGSISPDIILHVIDEIVSDDVPDCTYWSPHDFSGKNNLLWAVRLARIVTTIGQVSKTWSIAASSHTMWYNACKVLQANKYKIDLDKPITEAMSFRTLFLTAFQSECLLCHKVYGSSRDPVNLIPSEDFGHVPYCWAHAMPNVYLAFHCGHCFKMIRWENQRIRIVANAGYGAGNNVCIECFVRHGLKMMHPLGLDPAITTNDSQAFWTDIRGSEEPQSKEKRAEHLQEVYQTYQWYSTVASLIEMAPDSVHGMSRDERTALEQKWVSNRLDTGIWLHPEEQFAVGAQEESESSSTALAQAQSPAPPFLQSRLTAEYLPALRKMIQPPLTDIFNSIGMEKARSKSFRQIMVLLQDLAKKRAEDGAPFSWKIPANVNNFNPHGATRKAIRDIWLDVVLKGNGPLNERAVRPDTMKNRPAPPKEEPRPILRREGPLPRGWPRGWRPY